MSSTEFHVTCPRCGAAIATSMESERSDRLRGTNDSCSSCETDFELYYY
ncbi:MAG: hypothetical protein QXG03_10995 [Halalkalicoccus sp.]